MNTFYRTLLNICSILFIVIIVTTMLQVVFRFVLDSPLSWSDELARFAFIWMIFLGSSVVSFREGHLGVDFLYDYLSDKTTRFLKAFSNILIFGFLITLVIGSIELLFAAHLTNSPALEIPFSFWRGSVVLGAILMILAMIYNAFKRVKKYKGES